MTKKTLRISFLEFCQLSLTLCCIVVYFTRRFVLSLALCYFVLVFFSFLRIEITSLGEERANLSAFRTFVRFALVWFVCFLFLFVSGKGCGLWLWHSFDFSLTCFVFRRRYGFFRIWATSLCLFLLGLDRHYFLSSNVSLNVTKVCAHCRHYFKNKICSS